MSRYNSIVIINLNYLKRIQSYSSEARILVLPLGNIYTRQKPEQIYSASGKYYTHSAPLIGGYPGTMSPGLKDSSPDLVFDYFLYVTSIVWKTVYVRGVFGMGKGVDETGLFRCLWMMVV